MFTVSAIIEASLVWFGVVAETAPTLDYMADDR